MGGSRQHFFYILVLACDCHTRKIILLAQEVKRKIIQHKYKTDKWKYQLL